METVTDSRGAIRGRPCARRPACCAAPSAGSRLSASKAAPTPRPPSLGSYLLPSETGSHAHPHPVRVPAPGPTPSFVPPPPRPVPTPSTHAAPYAGKNLPLAICRATSLSPFPVPSPVLSSGKPSWLRRGGGWTSQTTAFHPPSLQPPGFGEMPVRTARKAKLSASNQDVRTDAG